LVELGHKGDEEGVFKLLIIKDGTVAETMFFRGTKETVATRRCGIVGRGETMESVVNVVMGLETMDEVVHVFLIGIVGRSFVVRSGKNLSHIAIVGVLELGGRVGRNVCVLVFVHHGRAIGVG
jgi:hypothetical protein